MKILAVFIKSLKEQLRDYWVFLMTVIASPFFVLIYWLMVGGGSTSYNVIVINKDKGIPSQNIYYGEILSEALKEIKYKNGNPVLRIEEIQDIKVAENKIKDRAAAALFVIPENFTSKLLLSDTTNKSKASLTIIGDISNPQYTIAGILANSGFEGFMRQTLNFVKPIEIKEELMGQGLSKTEFETYVPGLIIFSVIMLIYTVAMSLVREVENGTIKRIKLSNLSSFQYLFGVSITQFIVAVISVVLTIITAMSLGFRIEGSFATMFLILFLLIISIIGIGLIIVSFSKTATFVLSMGTFPLFILMFFTGAIFPMPRNEIFEIGGHLFAWNDALPPTYAVIALNKVMSLGGGFKDVQFELIMLAILSILYFVFGVWLFKKLHFERA